MTGIQPCDASLNLAGDIPKPIIVQPIAIGAEEVALKQDAAPMVWATSYMRSTRIVF